MSHDIPELAAAVRFIIEQSSSCWPPFWSQFPRGTCGDTSLILGAILDDFGYSGFEYVCGEMNKSDGGHSSHAWLQKEELIIDITADQFSDITDSVIVSTNSNWHKRWHVSNRSCSDLKKYPTTQVVEVLRLYRIVSENLALSKRE